MTTRTMTTRTILTLALAGLFLPLSAEAQVSRLDSKYGTKARSAATKKPTKAATKKKAYSGKKSSSKKQAKRQYKKRVSKPKPPTITRDLPVGFIAGGADTLPQEDSAISLLRKLLLYSNKNDIESAEALFAPQVKLEYVQMRADEGEVEEESAVSEDATTADVVMDVITENKLFTEGYEVFQLCTREGEGKKAVMAMIQQPSHPKYLSLLCVVDTASNQIIATNIQAYPQHEGIDKIEPSTLKLNADALIKMGFTELSNYTPIKSASAAESGGWWAPDMEFTTDPHVRQAILAPAFTPMNILGAIRMKDQYLFMRTTDLQDIHQLSTQHFAPRVYLIGQNKEVSRDELFSMFTQKDMVLPSSSQIIASGYKGHCLQFVISYTDATTKEKKYIRTCAILDNQNKIMGIMESKCVNASPKVNPSFTSAGGTVEVVEDSSANISREEWVNRFMQAWMSSDATTWDGLLHAEVGNLYLPGMSKTATGVPKSDAIELMQQSMPAFLAGGYDIVQVKGDDKCMTTATIIFKQPAPNGQKVKADIEINHIKDIHGFWVNMSYVEGNKKFTQADFVSAVEGSTPDTVAVEDQPIRDLPTDIKGAEIMRRTLEAIKTNNAQKVAAAMSTNHINQISMPKDNTRGLGRIGKPADVMADVRELIPNLDTVSYNIYITQGQDMITEGVLAINEGKALGAVDYIFSICYNHQGSVNAFSLRSAYMPAEIVGLKQQAGEPKIKVGSESTTTDGTTNASPESAAATKLQSLCPADADFTTDSLVKAAESTEPTYAIAHPAILAQNPQMAAMQVKPAASVLPGLLDNNRMQLAKLYKDHRLSAATRKDINMVNMQASVGLPSVLGNQITVIGESSPVSADDLNARLDSPDLVWSSDCSIYKIGAKGSALQVIYRLGKADSEPIYINTWLLSNDLFVIHGLGESVLINKEPQLAPGYKEVKPLFSNMQ